MALYRLGADDVTELHVDSRRQVRHAVRLKLSTLALIETSVRLGAVSVIASDSKRYKCTCVCLNEPVFCNLCDRNVPVSGAGVSACDVVAAPSRYLPAAVQPVSLRRPGKNVITSVPRQVSARHRLDDEVHIWN